MKCIADVHYTVERYPDHAAQAGEIRSLTCAFCEFSILKNNVAKPPTSKSGLGRYSRMRGKMVAHLHKYHREELERTDGLAGR